METVGVLLLAVGAWVAYCGTFGMDPLAVAQAILKDPSHANEIIADARMEAAQKVATVTGGTVVSSGDGGAVVAFARSQIGKPYRLGGAGPDVWDCSGLTMVAYSKVGVTLPHSALAQSRMGVPIVERSKLQPGDLLFPTGVGTALGDHVQIYSGNGNIIEAPRPGVPVRERLMWGFSGSSVTARRLVKRPATTTNTGGSNGTAGDYYGSGAPASSGTSSTPTGNTAGNYYGSGAG